VRAALKAERNWAGHVSVVTPERIQMIPVRQTRE